MQIISESDFFSKRHSPKKASSYHHIDSNNLKYTHENNISSFDQTLLDYNCSSGFFLPPLSLKTLSTMNPLHLIGISLNQDKLFSPKTLISFNCEINSTSNTSLNLNFLLKKSNGKKYSTYIHTSTYRDAINFSGVTSFSFQSFDLNEDITFFDNIYYSIEIHPIDIITSSDCSIGNCSISILTLGGNYS